MVLHFSPLGQGSPRPLVAGGSGIVLEGDLENLVRLRQRRVGCGSKGLACDVRSKKRGSDTCTSHTPIEFLQHHNYVHLTILEAKEENLQSVGVVD